MFKVKKTLERHQRVFMLIEIFLSFIVNFGHILHRFLFLLLTLNR